MPRDARVHVWADVTIGESQWKSDAVFAASADDEVDPAAQSPAEGSYGGRDPAGLLWSLSHVGGAVDFPGRTVDPIEVDLAVSVGGQEAARAHVTRFVLDPSVERKPLREGGLVGTFFAPRGGGPHPAVLVLGGSEGGLVEGFAAALARHGFAALALAYFMMPGLPSRLVEIPVEMFRRGLDWLQAQPETTGRPAVAGASKGGEAALLVASTYDDVGAVIGVVPSGAAFMGIGRSPLAQRHSSWTLSGRPLPFVPSRYTLRAIREFASRRPLHLRVFYEEAMANEAAMAAAAFPLERVHGPVLLLSGQDDQLWPSAELSERAAAHLRSAGRPVEHIAYRDAGHFISIPHTPAVTAIPRAFAGRDLVLGGTRPGVAAAAVDGWRRVVDFLRDAVS